MRYIERQLDKYYRLHGSRRPVPYAQRKMREYEEMHAGLGEFAGLDGLEDAAGRIRAQVARLRASWPDTSVYPGKEAARIYGAVIDAIGQALKEVERILSNPLIHSPPVWLASSAPLDAVTLIMNGLRRAQTDYVANVKANAPDLAQGGWSLKKQVTIPNMRWASLRALDAVARAYDGLAFLEDAIPSAWYVGAVQAYMSVIEDALSLTGAFIKATWGGIKNLPDNLRAAGHSFGTAITVMKWGAVLGGAYYLYNAFGRK